MGLYGFLIASATGYLFTIIVLAISNRKMHLMKNIAFVKEPVLKKEMLQFSVPLIFSGLSWWTVSSSDRYFVSWLCGTGANGVYSVAYKIPTILQALDNVFGQAWTYTLYDSYHTEDGRKYLSKVYDIYSFVFCVGCSFLIIADVLLSKLLFANEFFEAWRYVPPLLLSIVFNSAAGLMGNFLSVYKKTKISMYISVIAAVMNVALNGLLIWVLDDAMGAAIATAITFFVRWACTTTIGMKVSDVKIQWKRQLLMYLVLTLQSAAIIQTKSALITSAGMFLIIALNWDTILWIKDKWIQLIKIRG